MENIIAKLRQDFEQEKLSRRQLIRGLALGAMAASTATVAPSVSAVARGLKGVGINHISFDVQDYNKLREFYADLFGMQISQGANKTECRVQCGDTLFYIRNPDNDSIIKPHPIPSLDHIAISVEPWENQNDMHLAAAPTVAAELMRRGIEIVPGATEVMIRDPEGFVVQLTGRHYGHSWPPVPPAAAIGTGLKAVGINHFSFDVQDYNKLRDFYGDLLGMQVSERPDKTECRVRCGDTFFYFRNSAHPARLNHIAISVEPWENQNDPTIAGAPTVAAELKRRGIETVSGATEVMIKDPEGFVVQLIGTRYQAPDYKIVHAK
jgi:catechol 2,3-dioxygenase-like lactoylglutathione lyase family enzyme